MIPEALLWPYQHRPAFSRYIMAEANRNADAKMTSCLLEQRWASRYFLQTQRANLIQRRVIRLEVSKMMQRINLRREKATSQSWVRFGAIDAHLSTLLE